LKAAKKQPLHVQKREGRECSSKTHTQATNLHMKTDEKKGEGGRKKKEILFFCFSSLYPFSQKRGKESSVVCLLYYRIEICGWLGKTPPGV